MSTFSQTIKTCKHKAIINKENSTELKKKLTNHITKSGKKQTVEKAVLKSFKAVQRSQKKNHGKITKLSVIHTIPIFKIIKLTNKKRRKKSVREIPALVSSYKARVSLGIKYLIKAVNSQSLKASFSEKFRSELISGLTAETNAVVTKNNAQTKALAEKKYFRFYRW
jgi:ribosomal protein S7